MNKNQNNHYFRGFLQSGDGIISEIITSEAHRVTFRAAFALSDAMVEQLRSRSEHLVFSERSRIARLGIHIENEAPQADLLSGNTLYMTLTATSVIPGYPRLEELKAFFAPGLPVGRLVFCDPDALLTSDMVLESIRRGEIKLPSSTTISSDGRILISPHKVICLLTENLNSRTLGRILLREDGREILNRFQSRQKVAALTIPPAEGVITTCSMYLNEHYVVLQSENKGSLDLGSHFPATVLDPIKTRGIRIYLEIVNTSAYPIVNPLISARIYRAPKTSLRKYFPAPSKAHPPYSYEEMRAFEKRMDAAGPSNCFYLDKPIALIPKQKTGLSRAAIQINGPDIPCPHSRAVCAAARRDFSAQSLCAHKYATEKLKPPAKGLPATLAAKYFPNILEHREIVNLVCDGTIDAFYFFEPSCEHGAFLSQNDHNRLQEYNAFGLSVYWVCGLNNRLMVHTIRDGKGYFVDPERLADFHKSMLFAFYGSNQALSPRGIERLGRLMDALISFWGQTIGIVTGGGSGVMEQANTMARDRGILSGANFLEITDQAMTTDVDFCQVFQSSGRHSRQKWFEVTSFPIFNVGGLGTLEELGITLCNMKLSLLDPVPVILFDTEGNGGFWQGIQEQIRVMIDQGRAPKWIRDNIVVTHDPEEVIEAYREKLHLF